MLYIVIGIIVVALVFDYINGFHDAANSIATVVATKVLRPFHAVVWAAFWNFIAAFMFGTPVAKTIAKDVVNPDYTTGMVGIWVILAGLVGAILWDLITWYFGLPTSSSHALIGGLAGAALISARSMDAIKFEGVRKIVTFIVLSPMIGMLLGFSIMVLVLWIFRKFSPSKVDKWFRVLQLFSAAGYSLGHGLNDAQKTMGIIWMVLMVAYPMTFHKNAELPFWVILICHAAIALGTLSGGWKIVKTMGLRITKLKPVGGFCAETAGALTIIGASHFGIPVSTTHTITGAIVGVGATNRLSAVKWGVAGRIVWAWVLTIPASAAIAAGTYLIIAPFVR